ncbi:nucleotidyltransferase domain-containing protein [Paracoccus solventivorans]|uniref:nucleotidyltransferase domain-containing protein n=1 Tax=Paracoccus solventivorans TaxID=53463 RepID=UPI003898F758
MILCRTELFAEEIWLFGSRARGDYRSDSDWDTPHISASPWWDRPGGPSENATSSTGSDRRPRSTLRPGRSRLRTHNSASRALSMP